MPYIGMQNIIRLMVHSKPHNTCFNIILNILEICIQLFFILNSYISICCRMNGGGGMEKIAL